MKTLTTDLTLEQIIEAYSTLGKEGHILSVDLDNLTASCARVSKRAKFGQKQVFGYRFKTEERLVKYILDFYNDKVIAEEKTKTEKEQRKARKVIERDSIKEGDVFCYSWGWEQTNLDFYQVISKKGSSVIVREIGYNSVEECSWASEYVVPVKDSFCSDEFTVRLNGSSFKRSCGSANLTNFNDKHYRSWYA